MTKVGEGSGPIKEPSAVQYHAQLEANSVKFLNALESYKDSDTADRERLKPIMDQCLALMRSAVNEIKYAGINKQEVKVEKDYQTYMNNPTSDNFSALEQDLSTLRDYNKLQ